MAVTGTAPASETPATTRRLWPRIRHALAAAVTTVFLWWRRSQERRLLASLDGRALKDMGISRTDALGEYEKPFWRK
jgi:uncharacterized protein YjiS (DUF1127 family)